MRSKYFGPLVLSLALACTSQSYAASEADCQKMWENADLNKDGVLTAVEDDHSYIPTAESRGKSLTKAGTISRDEFLAYCKEDLFKSASALPARTQSASLAGAIATSRAGR